MNASMPGERAVGTVTWATRMRQLESELPRARRAMRERLRVDWRGAVAALGPHGRTATPRRSERRTLARRGEWTLFASLRRVVRRLLAVLTGRNAAPPPAPLADSASGDAYAAYGQLLAKLRQDPAAECDALARQLEVWRARAVQDARAGLATRQTRLLDLSLREMPLAAERLRLTRARKTELREVTDGGRILMRGLAACVPLSAAAALIAAEFSLAKQVTSTALGLEYAAFGGAEILTPVNLFAIALCALTLPFKMLADLIEEWSAGSRWRRFTWIGVLAVLALVLVGVVGGLRGDTSYWTSSAARQSASTNQVMPGGSTATDTTTAAAKTGDEDNGQASRALFVGVFVTVGVLFPLVGGAALSKAQRPLGDVIRGVANLLALWRLVGRERDERDELEHVQAQLEQVMHGGLRLLARAGGLAGMATFVNAVAGAIEAKDPAAAHELTQAARTLDSDVRAATPAFLAALAQAAEVPLAAEQAAGLRQVVLFLEHAIRSGDPHLDLRAAADAVARAAADALRQGYSNGLDMARELLAELSNEERHQLETCGLIHADFFGHGGARGRVSALHTEALS